MSDKVCVVTGCSSGVGLFAAILFAKGGYVTYATMRDTKKATKLLEAAKEHGVGDDKLKVAQLDVVDQASVDKCFDEILKTHGHVDVLINNAGFSTTGTIEDLTIEDGLKQFDTNVWGCVRTMKKVLPGMRERKSGRVYTVSSVGGVNGSPFNDVYCASKFAMEGLIESMAPVYRGFNVHLVLIEPGAIMTDFVSNADRKMSPVPELAALQQKMVDYYAKLFTASSGLSQTGLEVAQVIYDNMQDNDPALRVQTNNSPMYKAIMASKLVDPSGKAAVEAQTKRFFGDA